MNRMQDTSSSTGRAISLIVWSFVLMASGGLIVYIVMQPGATQELPKLPEPPTPQVKPEPPEPSEPPFDAVEFFEEHADPAIKEADAANKEAIERCVKRLEASFDKYREGVVPFTEAMTSWSTRWGRVNADAVRLVERDEHCQPVRFREVRETPVLREEA